MSKFVFSTTLKVVNDPTMGTVFVPDAFGLPSVDEVGRYQPRAGAATIAGTDDYNGDADTVLATHGVLVFVSPTKSITSPCTAADKAEIYHIVEAYTGIQPTNAAFLAATSGAVQKALEYAYTRLRVW